MPKPLAVDASSRTVAEEHLTSPGTTLGTVAYMSPEQVLGKDLDARTDLFSFGVVLYEMATATLPFRGETPAASSSIPSSTKRPSPPLRLNPDVPPKLDDLIAKCLEKDRDVRYQSANELKADLKRVKRDTDSQRSHITAAEIAPSKPKFNLKPWLIAAAVVLVAVVAFIVFRNYAPSSNTQQTTKTPAKPAVETIAVLPFRDLSASSSDSWAIGITDAIISRLTSLKNLAVRPTTSVMKYAKETPEPTEAAKALGVESILEGTYQRSADVTRVTVQLIDGHTGTTKWSQRYDLHNADILTFEDQVASKVVEGLQIEISPTEQKAIEQRTTTSVEAYNDYLQARFYLNEYLEFSRVESLENGRRLLIHATSLDDQFADAYALLAVLYSFQSANFPKDAGLNLKLGEQTAQKALKINPDSTEGLIALGGVYGEEGRTAEALRILRRAVALAPNHETAWQMLAYSYYYAGLNQLAITAYSRVIALNPTPPQPHWMHARMLLYAGRGDDAERELRDLVAKNPNHFKALAYFGMVLYYQEKLDEAEPILDRAVQLAADTGDDSARMVAAFLYAARHENQKIDRKILQYRPEQVIDADTAHWIAGIYALLGDHKAALVWLQRAIQLGDLNYPWYEHDKNLNSLRADPGFQRIMTDVRTRSEAYRKEFGETP